MTLLFGVVLLLLFPAAVIVAFAIIARDAATAPPDSTDTYVDHCKCLGCTRIRSHRGNPPVDGCSCGWCVSMRQPIKPLRVTFRKWWQL